VQPGRKCEGGVGTRGLGPRVGGVSPHRLLDAPDQTGERRVQASLDEPTRPVARICKSKRPTATTTTTTTTQQRRQLTTQCKEMRFVSPDSEKTPLLHDPVG